MKLATYCLWSLFITASTALGENPLLSNFFLNSTAVSALKSKETCVLKRKKTAFFIECTSMDLCPTDKRSELT
jgi:hypothetical protein